MRLKYYLRGMGIGIIVTTIILAISFSNREIEISDEQVMVRAAALGMIMPEEDEKATETETAVASEAELDNQMVDDVLTTELPTEQTEMVETEMAQEVTENSEIEEQEDVTEETETETEQAQRVDLPTEGVYRLVINKGDVCRVVCEDLQANGVVADAEALRKHLFELGNANSISTGVYDVPYGLTMEEVAQIIVAGPVEEE